MRVSAIIKNEIQYQADFHSKALSKSILLSKPKWLDVEYRHGYMESAAHQTIAWQIKCNRKARQLTLDALSEKTAIPLSILIDFEDPNFEGRDIENLVKIANSFDCALSVEFISYSQLAYKSHQLTPAEMSICSFQEEIPKLSDNSVNHDFDKKLLR